MTSTSLRSTATALAAAAAAAAATDATDFTPEFSADELSSFESFDVIGGPPGGNEASLLPTSFPSRSSLLICVVWLESTDLKTKINYKPYELYEHLMLDKIGI